MRVKDNQSITFIDNYLRLTQCGKRKCWHNHKHTLHKRLSSLVEKPLIRLQYLMSWEWECVCQSHIKGDIQ